MKKLTTLLMTLMLMSTALWADETITVSAKSSDISEGLDLKVVAKLFAEAKNLEEFEQMLNNPDSAFCNLDLNDDGEVDYLRVVETGEGNKRLIVLQAVLAKDIFQDVASIYVEKDEQEEVKVQVVGDEYVYGTNYIIEPVYVYRPVIYDWFWSDAWYAWHSPWYWGYYPGWWYAHSCWAHDWYWHHCYAYHHHHYYCSFRYPHEVHHGYHELRPQVSRREYATVHPDRSFERRNSGYTNAREMRRATVETRQTGAVRPAQGQARPAVRSTSEVRQPSTARTTEVRQPSATRTTVESKPAAGSTRATTVTTTRSTSSTIRQPQRPTSSSTTATTQRVPSATTTRSTSSSSTTRSTSSSSTTRSTSSSTSRPTSSTPSRTSSSTFTPSRTSSVPSGSRSGGSSMPSSGSSGGGRTRR